jgi:hypothetical protein
MIGFLIFVVLVSGYILMIDNQATVINVNMVNYTYSGKILLIKAAVKKKSQTIQLQLMATQHMEIST